LKHGAKEPGAGIEQRKSARGSATALGYALARRSGETLWWLGETAADVPVKDVCNEGLVRNTFFQGLDLHVAEIPG